MPTKSGMSVNLGLPSTPEVDTIELYTSLMQVYNAIRNVCFALDLYTGNTPIASSDLAQENFSSFLQVQKTSTVFVKLTEAVSAGHTINFHNSGGLRARKAIVSSQPCHGFAAMAGAAGDTIAVSLFGMHALVSGLTPGVTYYQSSSPGLITAGATAQKLGVALSANALWFSPA